MPGNLAGSRVTQETSAGRVLVLDPSLPLPVCSSDAIRMALSPFQERHMVSNDKWLFLVPFTLSNCLSLNPNPNWSAGKMGLGNVPWMTQV